ncbi:hypothetical protein JM84_2264 [Dokdonia sp. Hel_I_63]|uniref:hypothetical protein n=1 Tax=Dokdonia sp. Hel_I_63 TaxID=1249996 RepID=UPI00119AD14C|nr:hypothetical protein [Dokdonia sp. Hel_I_63]TVZ23341.1 hypothetical protein JM84_2264 [Dokdonia sp. Hel_I_63]
MSTEERLKLIWDFRGPDAHKIALHHETHLKEYATAQTLNTPITGTQQVTEDHSIAFLVVDREAMKPVRDALKPHRGQLFT